MLTPQYVDTATCLLAREGCKRRLSLEWFHAIPDFRGVSFRERLFGVASAAEIASANAEALREFATHFVDGASPKAFAEMLGPVIRLGLLSTGDASSHRSAVIYSTLNWVALKEIETPLFSYKDEFIPYRVTPGRTGWHGQLVDMRMANRLFCLDWHIPAECDAARDFVMLRRERTFTQRYLSPRQHIEVSELFGYANLQNPRHMQWLLSGWFPSQMDDVTFRLGDSMLKIAHPGITCGWAVPGLRRDGRDVMASIQTYSIHPRTGQVVCVAIDKAFVAARLSLATDICYEVGKRMHL